MYTVKKTRWQSGGSCELRFVSDPNAKAMAFKNSGKTTEIRIAPGLSKDSKPSTKTLFESSKPGKFAQSSKTRTSQNSNKHAPSQPAAAPAVAVAPVSNLQELKLTNSSVSLTAANLPNKSFGSSSNLSASKSFGSSIGLNQKSYNTGLHASLSNLNGSATNLSASQQTLAAAAAVKKKPPPPPAKKVPRCEALYVRF